MRKKELRMQTRYEVNRLSKGCLSAAYEKLIPIITHQIEVKEKCDSPLHLGNFAESKSLDEESLLSNDTFSYFKRSNQC